MRICRRADLRILNIKNADVAADENPHFTHIHANLSLVVFPDSNWYISVVLLYVIAAGVRSNKRYSNPVAY